MGTYQPLTESLRELNRLMLDTQKWNADRQDRQQAWEMERMKFEEQKKNNELNRQLQEHKLAQVQDAMTPKAFNIYDFSPNTQENRDIIFRETNLANEVASIFGKGSKLSEADGMGVGPNGEPIALNKAQYERVMPLVMSTLEKYNDPQYLLPKQITKVEDELNAVNKEWGSISKTDPRFMHKRAEAEIKRNKLQTQLDEIRSGLHPDKLVDHYREQLDRQRHMLNAAISYGLPEQALGLMKDSMAQISKRLMQAEAEKLTQGTESLKPSWKLAHRLGPNGEILESRYMAIRNIGQGMMPYHADKTLNPEDKWVWDGAYNAFGKDLPKNQWDTMARILSSRFGKPNPNDPTQFMIPEKYEDVNYIAQFIMDDLMRKAPNQQPLTMINTAENEARNVVGAFFEQREEAVKKFTQLMADPVKAKEYIEKLPEELRPTSGGIFTRGKQIDPYDPNVNTFMKQLHAAYKNKFGRVPTKNPLSGIE